MKNLLICLVFILAGSSPLLSAYEAEEILLENSNIEQFESVKIDTSKVKVELRKVGEPKKKANPRIKKNRKQVVIERCKRPIARRGNMGNSGAMRNMYAAKFVSIP